MIPIIKKENSETILTSEITRDHIVVAVIHGKPAILSGHEDSQDHTKFLSIEFITNGSYFGGTYCGIEYAVNAYIGITENIKVFKKEDWKEAFKWLIDNVD